MSQPSLRTIAQARAQILVDALCVASVRYNKYCYLNEDSIKEYGQLLEALIKARSDILIAILATEQGRFYE